MNMQLIRARASLLTGLYKLQDMDYDEEEAAEVVREAFLEAYECDLPEFETYTEIYTEEE